nr:hypothetical protein GCM10020241_65030 [Streptoalloteichus tenebrarius]
MTTEPLTFPLANAGPFDPPSELMAMREGRPIAPLRLPDGRLGWVVVRRATVRSVLADPRFSARQELRGNLSPSGGSLPPAPPGMFIGMDPPDHTHYRHLLTGQFTVRRMRQLTARIEQLAEEHLDRMAAAGPPVDLVATYARPIPAMVICELLGVPDEFRERFGQQVAELSRQDATPEEQQRTLVGILTYLGELVREKRSTPTDDLLGGLVVDGGRAD